MCYAPVQIWMPHLLRYGGVASRVAVRARAQLLKEADSRKNKMEKQADALNKRESQTQQLLRRANKSSAAMTAAARRLSSQVSAEADKGNESEPDYDLRMVERDTVGGSYWASCRGLLR